MQFAISNVTQNPDPTSGFVQYVPFETAAVLGLVGNASDEVYLGVDHTNIYTPGGLGRPSVRLESKLTFTEGLFVVDLSHIPTGCGSWPAFCKHTKTSTLSNAENFRSGTVGLGDWPADGEIDIIENTNDAPTNNAALHAAGECDVEATPAQSSTWKSTDCNNVHDDNQGCGTEFTEPNSYGETFNLNGGGVSEHGFHRAAEANNIRGLRHGMDEFHHQNLVFSSHKHPRIAQLCCCFYPILLSPKYLDLWTSQCVLLWTMFILIRRQILQPHHCLWHDVLRWLG